MAILLGAFVFYEVFVRPWPGEATERERMSKSKIWEAPEAPVSRAVLCAARVNSREFGWGACYNRAKSEKLGLPVCRVHERMLVRFLAHGIDYTRAIVRAEWKREIA